MGMYDYLGGEQIKIFYRPIFSKDSYDGTGPDTWHSGGTLTDYTEMELPLHTMYYNYPDNFIVVDFRYASDIWIIKGGKFKELKNINEIKLDDLGEAAYNYYGHQLNIKTVKDAKIIGPEWKHSREEYNLREKKLIPPKYSNIYDFIKQDIEGYMKIKPDLDKIPEDTTLAFSKSWYAEDSSAVEKQFGEFLDCYINFKGRKDEEVFVANSGSYRHDPMEDYLACKRVIWDFITEHPDIQDKYLMWVHPTVMNKEQLDILMSDIIGA